MLQSLNPQPQGVKRYRRFLPACIRGVAAVMIPVFLLTSLPFSLQAATSRRPKARGDSSDELPDPVLTPKNVKVNKTQPKFTPFASTPRFSDPPTDVEIFQFHVLEEPLVPVGVHTTPKENRVLVRALQDFKKRTTRDDFSAITRFLDDHPQSAWNAALLLNLGIECRRTGWWSKAMESFETSWNLSKDTTDLCGKAVADRAVGELAQMNAWVGRFEVLDPLMTEIGGRVFKGPSTVKISSAKEGLWMMKNRPEVAFKCGPYALDRICASVDPKNAFNEKIRLAQSTQQGFNLAQVQKLAKDLKMDYQMAKRSPGAGLMVPAVIHWKLNHYGALLKERDGMYLLEDSTFDPSYGHQCWVSKAALEAEASGYFLVPKGKLPQGWQPVEVKEGQTIWGKGFTTDQDPNSNTKCDKKSGGKACEGSCSKNGSNSAGAGGRGMAEYSIHTMLVSLNIEDTPVGYAPPRGPSVDFTVTYNQREANQPSNFYFSNLGPKWTFDWMSYVTENGPESTLFRKGGGAESFTALDNSGNFSVSPYSHIRLHKTDLPLSGSEYSVSYPDGSREIYGLSDGANRFFLTQSTDPSGNTLTYSYDIQMRLVSVTDAIGQVTVLSYENADPLKITKVTDPFGRFATFDYDGSGRLIKITDVIGIMSQFTYDGTGDFINSMTTPYGTTIFVQTNEGTRRVLDVTNPLGQRERVEFRHQAPGINAADPANTVPTGIQLQNDLNHYRNSFYWDAQAMEIAPEDYTKATIYHWLHSPQSLTSRVLESTKRPLENRVWFNYPGQASSILEGNSAQPSLVARVMDDGTTQLSAFTYNSIGKVTLAQDPSGRITQSTYDTNQIDLLEVRQQPSSINERLASFTYNAQHLPLTMTDAAGQTTTFTYNAAGQPLTITNAKNETTTLAYDANGYLQSITGALPGSTTTFTYDGFGRPRTVTDSEGYTVTTDYDALDRPTKITVPDGTFEQIVYNRLDAVTVKDRLGRLSHTTYDQLRRVIFIKDALGRLTKLDWCNCGSLEKLTDPLGQVTTWFHDLQGRTTDKVYADNTTMSYAYESATSRLKSSTDAKGQVKNFTYFNDNDLKQVSYANAVVATPPVNFEYDSSYNRPTKMTDGTGDTTFAYNPITNTPTLGAGMLSGINGPLSNDVIQYSYDELSRVLDRSINGVSSSVVFDAIGRSTSATNPLGTFTYGYVNTTARLNQITLPNGQNTLFDYFNNNGDQRLKTIHNKNASAATLSKFDYEYNAESQITKWTQQADAATPTVHHFEYDSANQLLADTVKNQLTSAILKQYIYGYDKAGNRTSEQINHAVTTASHNSVNQLTGTDGTGGGPTRFEGDLSELATVNVSTASTNVVASVDSNKVFRATLNLPVGTNTVAIVARDYSGNNNTSTNRYKVVVGSAGGPRTLTYDLNGNCTGDGVRTYEWDAKDQLVAINQGTHRTEMEYDGMSRRVHIVEKESNVVVDEKRFVWCGMEICEERDGTGGTVTKRFYGQGVQVVGGANAGNYFYTRDHLGSVREVVGSDGTTVAARYDYDPYGRRTLVSGTDLADFGFTGHYVHKVSGLNLALFRAYDADLGRYLSRDPIGEAGGPNLYAYVHGNPINYQDPHGLAAIAANHGIATVNITSTSGLETSAIVTSSQLVNMLNNAPPQSISSLQIVGHGHPSSVVLSEGTSLTSGVNGKTGQPIIVDENGNDVTQAFQHAMNPFGSISLPGCNTARGDDNVAEQWSAALEGMEVSGSAFFSLGIPALGIPITSFGLSVTYGGTPMAPSPPPPAGAFWGY